MITLRSAAQQAKGELWQLDSIELDKAEFKEETFTKSETIDGKIVVRPIVYNVMIVDGKKYTIREKQLNQIKEQLEKKPLLKKVRFMKFDDGKVNCIPLE